jgi:hypothetical protein
MLNYSVENLKKPVKILIELLTSDNQAFTCLINLGQSSPAWPNQNQYLLAQNALPLLRSGWVNAHLVVPGTV